MHTLETICAHNQFICKTKRMLERDFFQKMKSKREKITKTKIRFIHVLTLLFFISRQSQYGFWSNSRQKFKKKKTSGNESAVCDISLMMR